MQTSHLPIQIPASIASLVAAGIDVIPCRADSKTALYANWQTANPQDMMERAVCAGKPFNLAVRCGGSASLVILDCEDRTTFDNAVRFLSLVGVERYPVVRTASGQGYHIWLRARHIPVGFNYTSLNPRIGRGEVRGGSGAYTLIPPSTAWSSKTRTIGAYTFETPDALFLFEDLQAVDWDEVIAPLCLALPQPRDAGLELSLPLPLLFRPTLPIFILKLLETLSITPPGHPVAHPNGSQPYLTHSEAEQAMISILILRGWPYPEIAHFFDEQQPPHYAAQAKPSAYLRHSFNQSLAHILSSPIRRTLADQYHWAQGDQWPYKSNLTRLAYLAIVTLGWCDATTSPIVTYNRLQEYTNASKGGLSNALARLEALGLIRIIAADPHQRIEICLNTGQKSNRDHIGGNYTNRGVPVSASRELISEAKSYLGPFVCKALKLGVSTVSALARFLRASRQTIRACLQALADAGLVVVTSGGWKWWDAANPGNASEKPSEAVSVPSQPVLLSVHGHVEEGPFETLVRFAVEKLGGRVKGTVQRPDPVPEEIYVMAMNRAFGVGLLADRLPGRVVRKLWELAEVLELMAGAGEVWDGSLATYLRWAVSVCAPLVRRRGWPYLWVSFLGSRQVLQWYVSACNYHGGRDQRGLLVVL